MQSHRQAFTLIELLMVITIMVILGSLLIPAVGWARTKAKITQSRAVIGDVTSAIESFNGTNGYYPMDDVADGDNPLANNRDHLRAALETVTADLFGVSGTRVKDGYIIDGWQVPLRYQHFRHYPPAPHPRADKRENSYQLWSCGPDLDDNDGSGDDLVNW